MTGRRSFLQSVSGVVATSLVRRGFARAETTADVAVTAYALPAWEAGTLEVHHIDTGRGNSTLILGPDGTALLIDAGEAHSAERTISPARPDGSRRAGEWIARYVRRQLMRAGNDAIDTMLLTHLHGDHVGEVAPSSPTSSRGYYRLTGAADVAEALRVRQIVDRGWPDYSYPAPAADPSAKNYIALARSLAQHGTDVQRARAGSRSQLALQHEAARYGNFNIRVLSVNGEVWTGAGEESKSLFPPVAELTASAMPNENMCCISLRLQYGAFRYYTGGDLCCDTVYGRYPWHDIETPVARAAGPVSVAVANHHGYFDACGPDAVQALQPRTWIVPTWHASHPAINVLANLFSEDLYAGERAVYALSMTPAALLTTERFSSRLKSSGGHVIVRVPQDGQTFTIYVIDSRDELGTVNAVHGPFEA